MIQNLSELKFAITELEKRKDIQKKLLVDQYDKACETLKSENLSRGILTNITKSSVLADRIINVVTSLTPLLLPKRFLFLTSSSLLNKLFKGVFGAAIKKSVKKYAVGIKDSMTVFLKRMVDKFV